MWDDAPGRLPWHRVSFARFCRQIFSDGPSMPPAPRTSVSHPLRIDAVPAPGGGLIGMTFYPGKVQRQAFTGAWDRDLALDLDAIRDWGAAAVVTLVEGWELDRYRVPRLGAEVQAHGMEWHHLPIGDGDVPRAPFDAAWLAAGPVLRGHLRAGRRIVLHCLGGLGRTSTVAAVLLAEMGRAPGEAVSAVRRARPGALETAAQVAYAEDVQALGNQAQLGPALASLTPASDMRDRARGALLGLALGDALGTTLEFEVRDAKPPHSEMTGGGPFGLQPGRWTDDTSMALALADSLIAHPGFDAGDLMRRFVSWNRTGAYSCTGHCFDIGVTTAEALVRFERTGDPFAGSADPMAAGNGSLMRLAPVALRHLHDGDAARRLAVDQSRTTHAAPQAVEACAFFVDLLREAILGRPKMEVLAPRVWDGDPAVRAIAAGAWRGRPRGAIESTGYVIHTLEAALWAVERTESFGEAVVLAVNLGGDADTVGPWPGSLRGHCMAWPGCRGGGWSCWRGARDCRTQRTGCWRRRGACGQEGDGAQGRSRTTDTAIFNRMLYQLSYLGPVGSREVAQAGPGIKSGV
jgi:ADP-ribosyl-[dinitrogen reductase] hydrolase